MKGSQSSVDLEGGLGDRSRWSLYFTEEDHDCARSLLILAFSDPLQSEPSENDITNEGNGLPSRDVLAPSDVQVSMVSDTGGSGVGEVQPFNLNEFPRIDMNGSPSLRPVSDVLVPNGVQVVNASVVSDAGAWGSGVVRPFDLNESPRPGMDGSPSLGLVFDLNMPPSSSCDEVILISSDDED